MPPKNKNASQPKLRANAPRPAKKRVAPTMYVGAGASSSSLASYSGAAAQRASSLQGAVSPYLAMVVDPMSKDKGVRYPDETIVPTAMVHLTSSYTTTIPSGGPYPGTVATQLRWKCDIDNPATAADTAPIKVPAPFGTGWTFQDYGDQQIQWSKLSAIDRTLSCGIRARIVALPTATYLPSGTLYFLQLQASESAAPFTDESACIQAVTAGKGFSMTVNELSKSDGVTLPYLPQGPMSFVFSDTNAEAPVTAGEPSATGLPPTVVSANGSVFICGFGLQEGMSIRFDYAHHIEYIPRAVAAGLVSTKVEPPSSVARDAISRGAQAVQQSLAGATSLGRVSGLVTGGGLSALSALSRAAVSMIPGATAAAGVAKAAAENLGAPAWLKSALGFLA